MKRAIWLGTAICGVMLAAGALADDLKSGPQVGKTIPGPFHPFNVTGPSAGEKHCLIWQNGGNPVAMIFAREVSDNLTSLVKKIDEATTANSKAKMGSFVVFCSDEEDIKDKLKELAKKADLKKCVLTVDNPSGPTRYGVAKDADVTVILYAGHKVKANHAFKKGELNDKAIEAIVADVTKILPEKKGDK